MSKQQRTKVATSHEGLYSYWLDRSDRYIYQRKEWSDKGAPTGEWIGWMCSEPAWERTFQHCDWMTLAA